MCVKLEAQVLNHKNEPPAPMSQQEMRTAFGVSDRTLRTWAERGLPVLPGPQGRPRYAVPDALIWGACYHVRSETGDAPRYLSVAEARRWHLARQVAECPADFVSVPLDHDHPERETMLRVAAVGRAPPPPEDDDIPEGDENPE